jgi:tetratricopeptide (TPR) repeat protein
MGKTVLFISHNAADRPYAQALKQFIDDLLLDPNLIDVRYSTSADTGPEGGEAWRDWIHRAVVEARTTLIIVTPHALGKPWLLWEAGAVKGAALARGATPRKARGAADASTNPLIVSLAYGLPVSECPDPLRGEQIISGNDVRRLEELVNRILLAHEITGETLFKAGNRIRQAFDRYLPAVEAAMQRAPSLINEANVQDWLKRLELLAAGKRLSELAGFERWMMLAFGRDTEEDATSGGIPIDVRLHRTLGEMHLGQRQYSHAVRQLRLAWRAAPRDIYVLRPLAEASMKNALEGGDADNAAIREQIRTLLAAIRELDDKAFTATPEASALLAKYHRRVLHEPDKALEIYGKSLEANPDSYYLADLIAQTELELKRVDAARAGFERALGIIERLGERNIWSLATAATACIGLARPERAREHLSALLKVGPPSASQAASIAQGIREVAERTGMADGIVADLLVDLEPQREQSR